MLKRSRWHNILFLIAKHLSFQEVDHLLWILNYNNVCNLLLLHLPSHYIISQPDRASKDIAMRRDGPKRIQPPKIKASSGKGKQSVSRGQHQPPNKALAKSKGVRNKQLKSDDIPRDNLLVKDEMPPSFWSTAHVAPAPSSKPRKGLKAEHHVAEPLRLVSNLPAPPTTRKSIKPCLKWHGGSMMDSSYSSEDGNADYESWTSTTRKPTLAMALEKAFASKRRLATNLPMQESVHGEVPVCHGALDDREVGDDAHKVEATNVAGRLRVLRPSGLALVVEALHECLAEPDTKLAEEPLAEDSKLVGYGDLPLPDWYLNFLVDDVEEHRKAVEHVRGLSEALLDPYCGGLGKEKIRNGKPLDGTFNGFGALNSRFKDVEVAPVTARKEQIFKNVDSCIFDNKEIGADSSVVYTTDSPQAHCLMGRSSDESVIGIESDVLFNGEESALEQKDENAEQRIDAFKVECEVLKEAIQASEEETPFDDASTASSDVETNLNLLVDLGTESDTDEGWSGVNLSEIDNDSDWEDDWYLVNESVLSMVT